LIGLNALGNAVQPLAQIFDALIHRIERFGHRDHFDRHRRFIGSEIRRTAEWGRHHRDDADNAADHAAERTDAKLCGCV